MIRVTDGCDINFNVSEVRGLGSSYEISFYTTDRYSPIEKTQDNVDNGIIRLEWTDLESLGQGVLNYTVNNQSPNISTFTRTTKYYIQTNAVSPDTPSGGGDGSSVEVVDNLNSTNSYKALSAKQGKILRLAIEELRASIAKIAFTIDKPTFSWESETPVVTHNVTWTLNNLNMVGSSTVNDGSTWTGTLSADSGYTLPETITADNVTGTYDSISFDDGVITITNVTSDIAITASGVEETTPVVTHNVTWTLNNLNMVGNSSVNDGETWTGTLSADSGYTLPESITSDNVTGTYGTIAFANGVITITNVTSDIAITANGVQEVAPASTHTVVKKLLNYGTNDTTDTVDSVFGYLNNTVEDGATYVTYITPNSNATANNDVRIKMGNTVITDNDGVYDAETGKIEITNVTDDIVIIATAATGVIKVTASVEDGAECSITINGTTYPLTNGENELQDSIKEITSISLYNTTYASNYTGFDFGGAVMDGLNLMSKFRLANMTSCKGLVIKNPTSLQYLFFGCKNLAEIQTIGWMSLNTKNLAGAFSNNKALTSLDVEDLVGSSATSIVSMLDTCNHMTTLRGVDTWNISNVTSLNTVFNGCDVLGTLDISSLTTSSSLTSMINAFNKLDTIIIGNLNTSGVTTDSNKYISSTVKTVECTTATPPASNTSDFWLKHFYGLYHNDAVVDTASIIVPVGSLSAYQESDGWSEFKDIISEKQ